MQLKQRILFFIIIIFLVQQQNGLDRHVIGARPVGLMSNFIAVLNHLYYCQKNNKVPIIYWDSKCPYYNEAGWHGKKNVWEYYFEPVSPFVYVSEEKINCSYLPPDGEGLPAWCQFVERSREWGNWLIRKYIRPRKYILEKVEQFVKENFDTKYIISLHLRGTDKKTEIAPTEPNILFSCANAHAEKIKNAEVTFFIATDEDALFDLAKQKLHGPVIGYDSQRSSDGGSIHHATHANIHKAQAGEEMLIEVLLLARTNFFIHTCSNVSTAVLFFNPNLEHKYFGQM